MVVVSPLDKALLEKAYGKIRDLAIGDAAGKGKPSPFTRTEHRGVAIDSTGPTQAMAILDGRLVVTNGVEALKNVIDRARDRETGDRVGRGCREAAGIVGAGGVRVRVRQARPAPGHRSDQV